MCNAVFLHMASTHDATLKPRAKILIDLKNEVSTSEPLTLKHNPYSFLFLYVTRILNNKIIMEGEVKPTTPIKHWKIRVCKLGNTNILL